MTRNDLIAIFEQPKTIAGITYTIFSIVVVYLSLLVLAYEQKYWPLNKLEVSIIDYIDIGILIFFTADFTARIIILKERSKYLISFAGGIDMLAIVPSFIALFFPFVPSSEWLRALRLTRFFRILQFFKPSSNSSVVFGLFTHLLPWIGIAAAIKLAFVVWIEDQPFWIQEGVLDLPISVIGFATAILLGAKLSSAQARFYSVEDAICRIAGALAALCTRPELESPAENWAQDFLKELELKKNAPQESVSTFRQLANAAAKIKYDDSVLSDMSKDHRHVIHHINARTPRAFDLFMKLTAFVFLFLAIAAVPGFTGLLTTLLMVVIIGGMYVLIDDLDEPIAHNEQSLINVDLTPLTNFLQK